jgi:hypothetical protein
VVTDRVCFSKDTRLSAAQPKITQLKSGTICAVGCVELEATIGLYGLISYTVQQRTREIGIRGAGGGKWGHFPDGANGPLASNISGDSLRDNCRVGLTRLMASVLYGVKPSDWERPRLADSAAESSAIEGDRSFVFMDGFASWDGNRSEIFVWI